jgi:hypothetical protein
MSYGFQRKPKKRVAVASGSCSKKKTNDTMTNDLMTKHHDKKLFQNRVQEL